MTDIPGERELRCVGLSVGTGGVFRSTIRNVLDAIETPAAEDEVAADRNNTADETTSEMIRCLDEFLTESDRDGLIWIRCSWPAERLDAIDRCLGEVARCAAERCDPAELMMIVTAASGEPTETAEGINQRLVCDCTAHTPLMISADGLRGSRQRTLTHSVDIASTLLDWFEVATDVFACEGTSLLPLINGSPFTSREFVCFGDSRSVALRSSRFLFAQPRDTVLSSRTSNAEIRDVSEFRSRLTVKPDDPRDIHDVTVEHPDTTVELADCLSKFIADVHSRNPVFD